MEFFAVDVETANPDMASLCQIGIAHFQEGNVVDEWVSYINPEDYFDEVNVSIHGIDESTIAGAPTFQEISNTLYKYLDDRVAVCHTHFDRVAIQQAARRTSVRVPSCAWLDSARVARRAWSEFAWRGYGLSNICESLGYEFKHHDALEDAKAAGHILVAASVEKSLDLDGWFKRVAQPVDPSSVGSGAAIQREGNPEGAMYGEVMVFTGALEIPRREAADMASRLGCQVGSGVTKKTTILVVGDQDVTRLAGHNKSSKHRKAEQLMLKGIPIRILRESDFKEIVESLS